MKLRGKKKLLKLFGESNVDLVLHGHLHENHEYWRGSIRFLNGGGSVLGNTGQEVRCNLIIISERSIKTEQVLITDESRTAVRRLENQLVTYAAA
jgi:predicted phosphodiesterase